MGVPDRFAHGRYHAADALTVIHSARGPLIRFGTALCGPACVNVSTGEVVTMVTEASPPTFANTSVTHFWDSVRAVTARFPLYSSDDDDDEEPFRAERQLHLPSDDN